MILLSSLQISKIYFYWSECWKVELVIIVNYNIVSNYNKYGVEVEIILVWDIVVIFRIHIKGSKREHTKRDNEYKIINITVNIVINRDLK